MNDLLSAIGESLMTVFLAGVLVCLLGAISYGFWNSLIFTGDMPIMDHLVAILFGIGALAVVCYGLRHLWNIWSER